MEAGLLSGALRWESGTACELLDLLYCESTEVFCLGTCHNVFCLRRGLFGKLRHFALSRTVRAQQAE